MSSSGNSNADAINQMKQPKIAKYTEAINSASIDYLTKQQLIDMHNSHASLDSIVSIIDDAYANKPIYAARMKNQQLLEQVGDKPGLSQVVLAAGKTPVGDTTQAGLPSLIPDATNTASLVLEARKAQQKAQGTK